MYLKEFTKRVHSAAAEDSVGAGGFIDSENPSRLKVFNEKQSCRGEERTSPEPQQVK